MGVTGHYIDADWQLHTTTIDFMSIEGSHNGESIYKRFQSALLEFGLTSMTLAITMDNASNNDSFMALLCADQSLTFT